jgi:hypothetical protein
VRGCSSLIAADGRVLREHAYRRPFWYRADPTGFCQLGPVWQLKSHAQCTASVIADGRLFLRAMEDIYV